MIKKNETDTELRLMAEEDFTVKHAPVLQQELLQMLSGVQGKSVVLDLSRTNLIDSMGIKLLVGVFKSCQENGLSFCLEASTQSVVKVLHLCKLNQLFEIKEVQLNG